MKTLSHYQFFAFANALSALGIHVVRHLFIFVFFLCFAGDISAEELFRMFFGDAFTPGTDRTVEFPPLLISVV